MESIGVDVKILIAQVVNFFILFAVLSWVLYKPILKILDERKKKIESSLKTAEETQKKSEELNHDIDEKLAIAKKEALEIINNAKSESEKIKTEMTASANKEVEFLMKKAEQRILEQKAELKAELRSETAQLVIETTQKILAKNIDEETKNKFISESMDKINKWKFPQNNI